RGRAGCSPTWGSTLGVVAGRVFVHAKLVDLAADGVATDAEQLCRLDAPSACGCKRAPDQGSLEVTREVVEYFAGVGRDQAVGLGGQPFDPARGRFASRL